MHKCDKIIHSTYFVILLLYMHSNYQHLNNYCLPKMWQKDLSNLIMWIAAIDKCKSVPWDLFSHMRLWSYITSIWLHGHWLIGKLHLCLPHFSSAGSKCNAGDTIFLSVCPHDLTLLRCHKNSSVTAGVVGFFLEPLAHWS